MRQIANGVAFAPIGRLLSQVGGVKEPFSFGRQDGSVPALRHLASIALVLGAVVLPVGEAVVAATVKETGTWSDFITETAGTAEVASAGAVVVTVSPKGKPAEGVMNLRAVTLRPTQ